MCQHQTLYYQENSGYVVKCASCKKIQVGFNIIAVTFDGKAFEQFRQSIEKTYCNSQPGVDRNVKSILIPSPCEGMNLLLSLVELESLHHMLEAADNEMKAQNLLLQFQEQ